MGFLNRILSATKSPLDDAIEKYVMNYSSGHLSGYPKMTPSWEREIRSIFTGIDKKPLFRAIRTNKVNKSDLGIFWTFDPNAVSAYWGDSDLPLYVLVIEASKDDIDWDGTVEQYMKPQYAESEVRLKKNSHPKLVETFSDLDSFWAKYN